MSTPPKAAPDAAVEVVLDLALDHCRRVEQLTATLAALGADDQLRRLSQRLSRLAQRALPVSPLIERERSTDVRSASKDAVRVVKR